jgi:hypothetical protein
MASIPFDWAKFQCPTCNALPQQRCRTLTTGRTTDAHKARLDIPVTRQLRALWGEV